METLVKRLTRGNSQRAKQKKLLKQVRGKGAKSQFRSTVYSASLGGLLRAKSGWTFSSAGTNVLLKGKILEDTGRLRSSITSKTAVTSGPLVVTVGTNVVYANIHQFGSKGKDKRGRDQNVAARAFVVIQGEDETSFVNFLANWVRDGSVSDKEA